MSLFRYTKYRSLFLQVVYTVCSLNLDDIEGTCQRNRAVAASVGRKDLMEVLCVLPGGIFCNLYAYIVSIITLVIVYIYLA